MRGILEDDYGLPHQDVIWALEREDAVLQERASSLRIERLPPGARAEELLLDGRLDAVLHPDIPAAFLRGDPRIVRLFADSKERERAYFKKTGIFPIMHVTMIRRDIVERFPWAAINLRKAFDEAKRYAYARIRNPRNAALAWGQDCFEDQLATLGPDPWKYGLTDRNKHTLETIRRYAFNQGIIKKELPLDDLFVDDKLLEIPEGI